LAHTNFLGLGQPIKGFIQQVLLFGAAYNEALTVVVVFSIVVVVVVTQCTIPPF
jgi:hypothetical protein